MKSRSTVEIVRDLIGPINAVDETRADEIRLKNLEELIEVVDRLMFDISQAAHSRNNYQSSVKQIGQKAYNFLKESSEAFEEYDMYS